MDYGVIPRPLPEEYSMEALFIQKRSPMVTSMLMPNSAMLM
jgi:hypothetical protein